ncbi:sugar ABC transporter substrate-binding protein [uncultured Sphaerochaeta sp.]|uniref:sugar ABC transporter substrate-binding protein n=1 Tax=uncultured Sphaerochaeta sp. TaxID=886478 RepID=UPI002A0A6708|nr:sugar ABC transporter substrate-binding protein [uncultured Sphaerochaeta sp.]
MKKVVLVFLVCLLALSSGFAQGSNEKNPAPENGEKKMSDITIAYVCSDLSNEIFAMQVKAMGEYAKTIGVKFIYKACQTTGDKITACENYISAGVDTIIVHVQDGPAMVSVMQEAQAAGVKFFAYDTNIAGADAYYGWKNYDLGYAIGENAANWVNATFSPDETVNAASCNYPSANFLIEREQGYEDALAKLAPNVKFIIQGVGGTASNGVTAGENFLQSGKTLNLVVGINDGGCLGVYEAFKAARYGNDKVAIFGCDATDDALAAIAEGGVYRGTITTGLIALAPDFIDIAVNLSRGKAGGEFYGPTTPINAANVKDYLKK